MPEIIPGRETCDCSKITVSLSKNNILEVRRAPEITKTQKSTCLRLQNIKSWFERFWAYFEGIWDTFQRIWAFRRAIIYYLSSAFCELIVFCELISFLEETCMFGFSKEIQQIQPPSQKGGPGRILRRRSGQGANPVHNRGASTRDRL